MNNRLPWDDLRVVLAIATAGSLSGAGRRLLVSHATVFRRLNEIEARLGVRLFERSRTGYLPTTAGEEVADAARDIERQVADVERRVVGRDLRPSGRLRVTTTDSLMVGLLAPTFARFRTAYPDIALEIAISNQVFSLSKREADVALRPAARPPEFLVGRKVGAIAQAVYGSATARADGDIGSADWVGPDEQMAYRELDGWMHAQGLNDRCRCRVDSVLGLHAAVRAGAGLGVLPCYLGEPDVGLVRLGEPIAALAVDLWLLTHPDLRRTGRIRAVMEFVSAAAPMLRERLGGREVVSTGSDP